jgi:hypothetical protein
MPDKARPPRASTAASLLTLGGQPAPSGMGASLAKVLLLQAAASADFDAILLGNIDPETTDDTVQLAARRFCREHEAELEDVYAAVQACRILLCGAARWNVHEAELKQDLATLIPDALLEPLLERLIPLYTQSFEPLRQQAVLRSLVEHSEVVRGIKWRVDVLKHSEHALEMNVPVATLSFACQHGDESKTVSLQLLPAELRTLRDTCNNILG